MKIFNAFLRLNLKTILFNFRHLPFKKAIRLPIYIDHKFKVLSNKGKIDLKSNSIKPFMIQFGAQTLSPYYPSKKGFLALDGDLILNGNAYFGHESYIKISEKGTLNIGRNFSTGINTKLICEELILIGDNCLISWDCTILDSDSHQIFHNNSILKNREEIKIGNSVWIGFKSSILKGCMINDGSVVGSTSLCNKKYHESNVLIAGIPAKIIKRDVKWSH